MAERSLSYITEILRGLPEDHPDRAFLLQQQSRHAGYLGSLKREVLPLELDYTQLPTFTDLLTYARIIQNQTVRQFASTVGAIPTRYEWLQARFFTDYSRENEDKIAEYIGLPPAVLRELVLTEEEKLTKGLDNLGLPLVTYPRNTPAKKGQHLVFQKALKLDEGNTLQEFVEPIELPTRGIPHSEFLLYKPVRLPIEPQQIEEIANVITGPFKGYINAIASPLRSAR